MKSYFPLSISLLLSLGVNLGSLNAQSCLNCWINPITGQQESLERIIPSSVPRTPPPPPVTNNAPDEAAKKPDNGEEKPNPTQIPISEEDPRAREAEPRSLPERQIDHRLRY